MSDKCKCEHTQHDCTLAENCRVSLMCKRVIESDTVTIDRAEYEAMKADAERYRWLRHGKTQSARVVFGKYPDEINIHDNKNHLINKELDQAIDQARKV